MNSDIQSLFNDKDNLTLKLNQLITAATSNRSTLRDPEYINNQACWEGLQWKLASYNQEETPFVIQSDINHLKDAINTRLGSLYVNDYTGELLPKSPEDVEILKTANLVLKNEWKRMDLDELIKEDIKSGAILGDGYIEILFNPKAISGGTNFKYEGMLEANFIDAAGIYIDASATDYYNSDYLVSKKVVTIDWIKRNHKDWYSILEENDLVKGGTSDKMTSPEIFKGRDYTKNRNNVKTLNTIYVKYIEEVESQNEDGTITTIDRHRIRIFYIIDDLIVGSTNDYPFDEYPILKFSFMEEPQLAYGIPLLRGLTIPQKVCNLIESAGNNIAMNFAIPTRVVSTDSGLNINDVAATKGGVGVVYMVNGSVDNAIKDITPPPLDRSLFEMRDKFISNIRTYAGVTDAYTGVIGTAGSTAQGTEQAIGRATIGDNIVIAQIQKFVERITRFLLKNIAFYYKDRKLSVRIDGKRNEYTFTELIVDNNMSNIDYDFSIDLSIKTNNDKNRQYNIMKDIYQIAHQYKDKKADIIRIDDLANASQLDIYNELYNRYENMTEEAYNEKLELTLQLFEMAKTILPNGTPLIQPEEIQEAFIEIVNDSQDLEITQELIQRFEEYQNFEQNNEQNIANNAENTQ